MLTHVPIALGTQLLAWLFGRYLGASDLVAIWLGWFAAVAVCVMREVTQQEYRWIARHGDGLRANLPAFAGLRFWNWNGHSKRETIIAVAAATLVAVVVTLLY